MNESTNFHLVDSAAARAADAALALEFLQAALIHSGSEHPEARGIAADALPVVRGWLVDESAFDDDAQPASLGEGLVQARWWADAWLRRQGIEVTTAAPAPSRQLAFGAGQWLRLALRILQAIGLHAGVDRRWECHDAGGPGAAIDLRPVEPATVSGTDVVRPLGGDVTLGEVLAALLAPWGGRLEPLPTPQAGQSGLAVKATSPPAAATLAGWRLHLPTAASGPGAVAGRSAGHVLLYVEDDPINLLLVQELAALRPGVVLHTAPDGETGLAMASRLRPALVFVDLHLPDIDGFEVLHRLRADPALANTPVLALSASTMPGMVERARMAGFVEYWRKPIHAERFLAGLDAWLARLVGSGSP